MAWTTTDLLATIKNRARIPDASSGSYSPSVLLEFASEELLITVLPLIMGVRGGYYETYVDTVYTSLTPSIGIPSRAINGEISLVQYFFNNYVTIIPEMEPSAAFTQTPQSTPQGFYFENNSIVLYPPPTGAYGTIRVRYFQRPSRLEQTSNCAQITAFNAGTGVVSVTPPTAWTTNSTYDFIPSTASKATPYGLDSVITAIDSVSMTFTSLPAAVAIGDWIALSEYTPIPEIPFEYQAILGQAAAVKALESAGDVTGLSVAAPKLAQYLETMNKAMTPRQQQGTKRVVSGWRRF